MFPQQENRDGQGERAPGRMGLPGCTSWGVILAVLVVGLLLPQIMGLLNGGTGTAAEISYSDFRMQVTEGNVAAVTIEGQSIQGELREPIAVGADDQTATTFVTYVPSIGDDSLLPLLQDHGVEISTVPDTDGSLLSLLLGFLPVLLLIGLGYFFIRRMQAQGGEMLSVGRSRAKLFDHQNVTTTFADVAGARGAKYELQEIVEYLKTPGRFQRLGATIPRGVLLVGPPGTGKTLLARAVAGEAGVPFFSISGSDFMEMFVGVGASRVRNMFEEAKKVAPSIIFIDEIDSVGRRRGAGLGGGHDEREQTLNQLLSELDGFEPNTNVIVMAATNRPDVLDPALLRPGRFDRQVTIDLPTMQDRAEILKIHARNKPLADDVNLERIARGTPGFSGADLENLLNEAALLAARKEKTAVEKEDVDEARDKILLGLERENMSLTEEERRLLAYHEGGHAILAAVLPHADPIHKVSIVPRGRAMGVTQQLPTRDMYVYPREYIMDRLAVMMGGRAAETLIFNTQTTGAENDLKQATQLARKMVLNWGMSEQLGQVGLGDGGEQVFLGEQIGRPREYSEFTAREIDQEIRSILNQAFETATATLQQYSDELDRLAGILLEQEAMPGSEVTALVEAKKSAQTDQRAEVNQ